MVKGSLLSGIFIVISVFGGGRKFSVQKGPKNYGLGVYEGKNLTLTLRPPRKSISVIIITVHLWVTTPNDYVNIITSNTRGEGDDVDADADWW